LIPTGVSFAASGLVGNCIGMNQVQRGKEYERISIVYSMIVTSVILFFFWIFSYQIAGLFTDDLALIKDTRSNFWALFLYIFWSTIKGV
jgi:Na+-driven multidrug efflux pump